MNNLTVCENCGGEEGLHEYDTLRCPRNGQESIIGRKQLWQDAFWKRPDKRIEQMRAQIDQLKKDATLADATYLDHLAALRAMAAEIAALKARIAELTKCKHPRVKIHSRLYRSASLYEPAEYEEKAQCQNPECGAWIDTSDIPEDAEVTE